MAANPFDHVLQTLLKDDVGHNDEAAGQKLRDGEGESMMRSNNGIYLGETIYCISDKRGAKLSRGWGMNLL